MIDKKPPVAKKIPKELKLHGQTIVDNYSWLRQKENNEVIDYLNAENNYTKEMMKHSIDGQQRLFDEFKGRIKETDVSAPIKKGKYFYYTRSVKDKQYSIYCRKKNSLENDEKVLLDQNIIAEGKEFSRLHTFIVNPDQTLVAYTVDESGYEKYTLYIKNINEDKIIDSIEEVSGSIKWADSNTFFYTLNDDIHRPYKVMMHKIGESISNDRLIFEEQKNTKFVNMYRQLDGKYLYISSDTITTSEVWYLDLSDLSSELLLFTPSIENVEYSVQNHKNYFYILTNENAINFKVMRVNIDNTSKHNWEEFIPHTENILIDGLSMFEDFIVLEKRIDGLMKFEILDQINQDKSHEVSMPDSIYSIFTHSMFNLEYTTRVFRFYYSSLVTPGTTYEYDIDIRKLTILKQKEIKNHNPSEYESRREFAIADDGSRIPISIVHKKGLKNVPTLLYGYGSYSYTMDPSFNPNRLSLLERGMAYAIAHIRGSSFLGRAWYENGKMLKKRNTFTDFNSCAEHLIKIGLTTSDKLAIMGGSAGGLLMGACVNMRPDLFKVVIAHVPFVDVINTMIDESIPLTTNEFVEWGNPKIKKYFDYMLSYSPYDQVKRKNYPRMLVTAGLNDPRVHYWEPAKWVAKLRDFKTDNNLLLLKTNMGAGHGGASGRYDSLKELAFNYSFLFDSLKIDY